MAKKDVKRASIEQTLEFANKVRVAGGGNPLTALMPAVPEDATECLVAKNLNFNCAVDTIVTNVGDGSRDTWVMHFEDKELRDRIADKLKLAKRNTRGFNADNGEYCIILPREIGQVAADFDHMIMDVDWDDTYEVGTVNDEYADLYPYIDESMKESYTLATKVKEDGSIVL